MKRTLFALALLTSAGYACAQSELSPVTVERANGARVIVACTPPNGAANCSYFHYLLRRNFTEHEIGMLFGGATSYLEYPTSYDTTRERYDAFIRDIAENGVPVAAATEPATPVRMARYARSW